MLTAHGYKICVDNSLRCYELSKHLRPRSESHKCISNLSQVCHTQAPTFTPSILVWCVHLKYSASVIFILSRHTWIIAWHWHFKPEHGAGLVWSDFYHYLLFTSCWLLSSNKYRPWATVFSHCRLGFKANLSLLKTQEFVHGDWEREDLFLNGH